MTAFYSILLHGRSLLVLALAIAAAPALQAAETNAPVSRHQFSDFSLVAERNIFNTRRTPRRSGAPVERRETVRRSSSGGEYLSLVGTMNYEKGPVAFFEGSRSDYRKAARPGDKLGAHRLASIDLKAVRLLQGTNWFVLPVGKQLRSEEEGVWHVADIAERSGSSGDSFRSRSYSTPSRTNSPTPSLPGPAGPEGAPPTVLVLDPESGAALAAPSLEGTTNGAPAATDGENEVLRRLMQRREQEINR